MLLSLIYSASNGDFYAYVMFERVTLLKGMTLDLKCGWEEETENSGLFVERVLFVIEVQKRTALLEGDNIYLLKCYL